MKNRFLLCAGIFFLLFMIFFPLDFLGDYQGKLTSFLFGGLTEWFIVDVFEVKNARIDFSSDSLSMVVLIGVLLIFAVILTILTAKKYRQNILFLSKEIGVLYLAVIVMKYGVDKIFKAQFYLPEPNILYSRFGNLDKDILFWSTMGTSRFYSVFAGILELTAAVLILFNKTRTLGLLLVIGIFINIFAINIGFDISVKLFSLILLLMTVFALKNEWVILYQFLIVKKEKRLSVETISNSKWQPVWVFFKTAFLGLSLGLIFFPYVNSGNYNDDTAARPFIHGAFKNVDQNSDVRYVFFHRKHYLILMDKNENTMDFHYSLQPSKQNIVLKDYNGRKIQGSFIYQKKDSLIILTIGKSRIEAKGLNWREMKALKPVFHRVIEDVK